MWAPACPHNTPHHPKSCAHHPNTCRYAFLARWPTIKPTTRFDMVHGGKLRSKWGVSVWCRFHLRYVPEHRYVCLLGTSKVEHAY